MKTYEGWTLKLLKAELKKRGAKVSGRKKDLVERLEAYDRNQNFGGSPDEPSNVWTMHLPCLSNYRDLTSTSTVPLTKKEATAYLDTHEVKLGKKSKNLYKDRFLRYAKSCSHNNYIFIQVQCRAEMKRTVTYDVDIQLDEDGKVIACQCDCTAGRGPGAHCKHVRTSLFGLLEFVKTKTINVELSCTEKLQRFHQPPKLHAGSPVKAQNLGLISDLNTVLFDPIRYCDNESDVEYNTRFRSVMINSCVSRQESVPLMQTFGPANVEAIDIDHDYLGNRQSEIFLEKEGITKISSERIKQVEFETRGQANNQTWKMERTKRIQSSKFGEITKATARKNMTKLASELMLTQDLDHVKAIKHGHEYEDEAIREYERHTGNAVTRMGVLVDKDRPYLGTSVDGVVQDCVIEVKCPFTAEGKMIDHVTVPYLQKTSEGLKLHQNHEYYCQIQGQLHITGKSMCHFVVYTIADIKIIEVFPDVDFTYTMLMKLDNFFINYFKPLYLQKFFFKDYRRFNWG